MEEAIILRGVERLLAVFIGGLTIYLGYLLFVHIPEQREGDGKILFPGGLSVFVTRVGPGVFFALFGAMVVGISFYKGIVVSPTVAISTPDYAYSGFSPSQEKETFSAPLADERLKMRLQMEFLNGLARFIRDDLSDAQRRALRARTIETKLLLMERVWASDWGDFDAFQLWAETGGEDPVPESLSAAATYFRAGEENRP